VIALTNETEANQYSVKVILMNRRVTTWGANPGGITVYSKNRRQPL
jgi:hypothetical protein